MIDWSDRSIKDEIHVIMVDPHNLDITRGELEHLILSGCSVSYGYNTDTRVSAKLETLGSNYIDGSWLRIVHRRGDYEEELGTFVLQNPPSVTEEGGQKKYEYTLQSVLWALSSDYRKSHFSIGKGAYTLDVFDRLCKINSKSGVHGAGVRNHRYTSSKVFEVGDSYLSFYFDICSTANDRLDVDGHGRITINPYYSPSEITPSWSVDADDPRTMLLSGGVSTETSADTVPGRAIVIYTSGDDEIIGSADRPPSSEFSFARRGYMIATKYQVSDMTPATQARAKQLAQQYLNSTDKVITTKCSMLYFPCKCGETMYLTVGGVRKKYLIQSIDPIHLDKMTMDLTLKEV